MTEVFLLEDDIILGEAIKMQLEGNSYKVNWIKTIEEAKKELLKNEPSIYLLDINLPDGSGIEFCRYLRKKNILQPVIFITAIDDEDSVVFGLSHGGSDYIRKPFGYKELMARIRAQIGLLKLKDEYLIFENIKLNLNTQTLLQNKNELFLNRREFFLIKVLFSNPDIVLSREKLIEYSMGNEDIIDRTIDSHISHIRKKINRAGITGIKISSVYGAGYILSKENEKI